MTSTKSKSVEDISESPTIPTIPSWLKIFCIGALLRVGLKTVFKDALMRRVELVNPLTSWFRLQECSALSEFHILPYSGDLCHHPPLVISLLKNIPLSYLPYLFLFADLLIGYVLYVAASGFVQAQLQKQTCDKWSYADDVGVLLLDESKLKHLPVTVMCFYLFNPSSILTCLAQSTEVINNLSMALVVLAMVKRWYMTSCLFIAVSAYLSLYPIMLLAPVLLHVVHNSSAKLYDASKYVVWTILVLSCLFWSSYYVYNSWSYVHAVYGFILQAPDLTPNMGLFWYFFAEMFDHFRLFYLWVYQLNVFIYLIPTTIIFRKDPVIVCYILLTLIAIFKSYSNLGSSVLPLALLPLWSHTFRYMRNVLLVAAFLLVTPILAPCMWHLWIYAGAGNANFFYAVTLAYNTGHIFLLSDVLYAFLRYHYHLTHGLIVRTEDGEEATPLLK